eukprot:8328-Hanusia_phi.AAC.1
MSGRLGSASSGFISALCAPNCKSQCEAQQPRSRMLCSAATSLSACWLCSGPPSEALLPYRQRPGLGGPVLGFPITVTIARTIARKPCFPIGKGLVDLVLGISREPCLPLVR